MDHKGGPVVPVGLATQATASCQRRDCARELRGGSPPR